MLRSEQIPVSTKTVKQKESAELYGEEHAIVQVCELSEGQFRGGFELVLSGVSGQRGEKQYQDEQKKAEGQQRGRALGAFLSSMTEGEKVEFRYEWRHDSRKVARFNWRIKGDSISYSHEHALAGARRLHHGLTVTLGGACADYEFRPRIDSTGDSDVPGAWKYEVRPLGILIPVGTTESIGFTSSPPTNDMVLLSLPSFNNTQGFDAIVTGGEICAGPITVTVNIESVRLDENAVMSISAALKNLRSGSYEQIKYEASSSGCVYDTALLDEAMGRLGRWMADPRGYRVCCMISAGQPLPNSFMETVGQELFKGSPVAVRKIGGLDAINPPSGMKDTTTAHVLDLKTCFHTSSVRLNLFPGTPVLAGTGIQRNYERAPIDLADDGILLGHCVRGRATQEVRLSHLARDRHSYIIGATGTGKSTLLYNMVMQDIEMGKGVSLIDPHGDLYNQVLDSIPEQRADDVVLIDLCDNDYAVGLNFLECDGPHKEVQMNFIVNEMMMIFHQLYDMKIAGGPMFEMYMRNAMLLVMGYDEIDATLLDVVRVFEDSHFRQSAIKQCKNPLVVSFWKEQAEKAGGDMSLSTIAPYITCKLNQFTHNALLRSIIGQSRSTVDFRRIMDNGQILLVNLSKGLLGELDTQLLGTILIGKLFNAAMGRSAIPQDKRQPYYLYVDEFQNITTPTIADLLSEARKFGLCMTLANQNLGQLKANQKNHAILDAVLGNVATTLFFRMGPKDAKELEAYTQPSLNAHDLQHLPDHHVACRLLFHNTPTIPFIFNTLPARIGAAIGVSGNEIVKKIRSTSRGRYARPRADIDKEIMARWITTMIRIP